jgi:hypothetical protein
MAEYDGAGYPVAYILRKTTEKPKTAADRAALEAARMSTMRAVLQRLKEKGINPRFFGSDKDFQEIRAAKAVWPEAKHQLWYVKADRALELTLMQIRIPSAFGTRSGPFARDWVSLRTRNAMTTIQSSHSETSALPNSTSPSCPPRQQRAVGLPAT